MHTVDILNDRPDEPERAILSSIDAG